jgi:hypothetical protein
MSMKSRDELIQQTARRQFRADHPEREWHLVEASTAQMDERARYLFQAEEYLITHDVISATSKKAA